jgi:hypothetical protein
VKQLMALVDALEQQLTASLATAANLLSALVAELTGTHNDGKVSVPAASPTGRRGRRRRHGNKPDRMLAPPIASTLLQESRTALITAAVTGKIDVRHWQPPVILAQIEVHRPILPF